MVLCEGPESIFEAEKPHTLPLQCEQGHRHKPVSGCVAGASGSAQHASLLQKTPDGLVPLKCFPLLILDSPHGSSRYPGRGRTHQCRGTPRFRALSPRVSALCPSYWVLPAQPLPAAASPSFTSPLGSPPRSPGRLLKTHSRVALPGQGVALQARPHGDVGESVAAAAALDLSLIHISEPTRHS